MKTNDVDNELPATEADELFWLAVRYVANELSEAERVEFEMRVGSDTAACEAIADAVRLTAGLSLIHHAVPPLWSPAVTHAPTRRLLPVGVSAALVVLTGLVFTFWPSSQPTETDLASAELVNRWRLDSPFAAADFHDPDELGDEDAEILDESLAAPGWMMSAVRLSDELGAHP